MRHIAVLLGTLLLVLGCKSQEEQILAHYRARMDKIERENAVHEAQKMLPGGAVVPATPQPAPPAAIERSQPGAQPALPPERTDESADRTLQRAIQADLGAHAWLARHLDRVEVSVENGKVLLTGQVRSRSLLLALERRVADVAGTAELENRVVVRRARR